MGAGTITPDPSARKGARPEAAGQAGTSSQGRSGWTGSSRLRRGARRRHAPATPESRARLAAPNPGWADAGTDHRRGVIAVINSCPRGRRGGDARTRCSCRCLPGERVMRTTPRSGPAVRDPTRRVLTSKARGGGGLRHQSTARGVRPPHRPTGHRGSPNPHPGRPQGCVPHIRLGQLPTSVVRRAGRFASPRPAGKAHKLRTSRAYNYCTAPVICGPRLQAVCRRAHGCSNGWPGAAMVEREIEWLRTGPARPARVRFDWDTVEVVEVAAGGPGGVE